MRQVHDRAYPNRSFRANLGNEVRVAVILQLHQLRELFIEQALCQQLVQQAFQLGIRSHNYPPPRAGTVQLLRQRSVLQLWQLR